MGEEEDYEDAENRGNGNQQPRILQHIRPPNPIVFTDNMQRTYGKSGSCNMIFGHQRNGRTPYRLKSKQTV
jgi:hypothetical protein